MQEDMQRTNGPADKRAKRHEKGRLNARTPRYQQDACNRWQIAPCCRRPTRPTRHCLPPTRPALLLRDMLLLLADRDTGFTADGGGGVYGRPSTSARSFSR